ncbi:MAG TPA: hypothetical protein VFQ38_06395 [Longimicrobiales bacterium]|nr:hypothetical protein [Longimicrobiales bacterium]
MFTRCLFCHRELPRNEQVEYFPLGRRVAFDPARGRLWAICPSCARWNLAPIEERWEALEELEKLARDRGKLLAGTENISLIHAGELEVVRVGSARLNEEAWWRYGREFARRRRTTLILMGVETAFWVGMSFLAPGAFSGMYGQSILKQVIRYRRFGSVAWRGAGRCGRCGAPLTRYKFSDSKRVVLLPGADADSWSLRLWCPECRGKQPEAGVRLEGGEAAHVLRRIMAYRHFDGASQKLVTEATRTIELAGSPTELTRALAGHATSLEQLRKRKAESLALEIALNDQTERELLELELSALEARWREEEELARIVDGELTPLPPDAGLLGPPPTA